jgi:uncharacterized protein CbrC (UPF0167 family)
VSTTARLVMTRTHGNTRNTHELYTFPTSDAVAFLVRTKVFSQKMKDKVKAFGMLGRSFSFCEYPANLRAARLVTTYTRMGGHQLLARSMHLLHILHNSAHLHPGGGGGGGGVKS